MFVCREGPYVSVLMCRSTSSLTSNPRRSLRSRSLGKSTRSRSLPGPTHSSPPEDLGLRTSSAGFESQVELVLCRCRCVFSKQLPTVPSDPRPRPRTDTSREFLRSFPWVQAPGVEERKIHRSRRRTRGGGPLGGRSGSRTNSPPTEQGRRDPERL